VQRQSSLEPFAEDWVTPRNPSGRAGQSHSKPHITPMQFYRILDMLPEGWRPCFTHYDSCSDRAFTSSLSRRTISVVLRMSDSLRPTPIVDAIARNRAFNSQ
jgi:hypothetical protein